MKLFMRKNPLFSLCGLNCCLCPRFNTDGISKCPGCGGENFSNQHPTCAVATCNRKHDNVDYCFQCSGYPCMKYQNEYTYDSFISYKSVISNINEAKNDLEKYQSDLAKRQKCLITLLNKFNDGKSKGLYCVVCNDMPLNELEQFINNIDKLTKDMDIKEKVKEVKEEIVKIESKLGIQFKLRK